MSSILTNNGAMVALQTLKSINSNLGATQSEISTGKSIATAKDNSAVWAISKQMESDVAGFSAIQSSLNLGESTVAVASKAAETVTDLLTQIKGKIVASQESNVDRTKIQTDIAALRDQIGSVVGAAQFNGLNLLSNKETTEGSGSVNVLSSLDRSGTGVAAASISVSKQDLGVEKSSISGTAVATADNNLTGGIDATAVALTGNATTRPTNTMVVGANVAAGQGYSVAVSAGAAGFATSNTTSVNDISYVARDGDTANDVANGIASAFNAYMKENGNGDEGVKATVTDGTVTFTGSNTAGDNFTLNGNMYAPAGNKIGGGLAALADVDVTTEAGAEEALASIEGLIKTSIDSAASFGSAQGRIKTQASFVSNLKDSLKSGIGSLVDANMEEASARLQALQVQQQLATQSLSIANQAPQSILSLFR